MAGFIPEEIIQSVQNQIDIVDVISEYVQLQKKGRNYKGPCPFHQERDPSFTVSSEKQIFYCFGCTTGGNVFKFLMLHEGMTFYEAVKFLAQRVGVTLPETRFDTKHREQSGIANRINLMAKEFYRDVLNNWKEASFAREYLIQRGLTIEIIDLYELGYAVDSWNQLVRHFDKNGINANMLVNLGLAASGRSGAYDRFRSRIIFPIKDIAGNVVGFGGRVIGEGQPKYLNTPETKYFNKSRILYGLFEARRFIRELNSAVIVEGYMDVISARQHGVNNVVASLGTSLTREQVQLLMRYTREVFIAFDSDAAGVAATIRSLDLMQELGCSIRVVEIPDGKDPDDFLQKNGVDGWKYLLSKAESLIEYKIKHLKSNNGNKGIKNSAVLLEQLLPNLDNIRNEVEKAEAIKQVAARLHTSWDAVAGELARYCAKKQRNNQISDKIPKIKHNNVLMGEKDAREKAERMILRLVLDNPAVLTKVKDELGNNFFRNSVLRVIFEKFMALFKHPGYSPSFIFNNLNESEQKVLGDLLLEDTPDGEPDIILPFYIDAMKRFINKEHRERLIDALMEAEKAGNKQKVEHILKELKNLF